MHSQDHSSVTRKCEADGCVRSALPGTTPSRCELHVEDPDAWYQGFLAALANSDLTPMRRHWLGATAASSYTAALCRYSVVNTLLDEYESGPGFRRPPEGRVDADVLFVISAVSSGAHWNSGFGSVKNHLRRITGSSHPKLLGLLQQVVTDERYEQLRLEIHGSIAALGCCPANALLEIQARFEVFLKRAAGGMTQDQFRSLAGYRLPPPSE